MVLNAMFKVWLLFTSIIHASDSQDEDEFTGTIIHGFLTNPNVLIITKYFTVTINLNK